MIKWHSTLPEHMICVSNSSLKVLRVRRQEFHSQTMSLSKIMRYNATAVSFFTFDTRSESVHFRPKSAQMSIFWACFLRFPVGCDVWSQNLFGGETTSQSTTKNIIIVLVSHPSPEIGILDFEIEIKKPTKTKSKSILEIEIDFGNGNRNPKKGNRKKEIEIDLGNR